MMMWALVTSGRQYTRAFNEQTWDCCLSNVSAELALVGKAKASGGGHRTGHMQGPLVVSKSFPQPSA
jgi:hypothetical protein